MILVSKTYWAGMPFRFHKPPAGASVEERRLRASDFRQLRAKYWTPAGTRPSVAVIAMHPRVDFTQHYMFPRLLAAGIGCLGACNRFEGDATGVVHEDILLDVAACVQWLRKHRGVRRVLLLGNSGGGSLMTLYQAQATRAPVERIAHTPAGDPTRLATAPMTPADGLLLIAAHRGQGHVLAGAIDASVTDESDPLSCDPALDMYAPENGFRPAPTWSEYDAAFVQRYRAGQRARIERIDTTARMWRKQRAQATERVNRATADSADSDGAPTLRDTRSQLVQPVLVVYRTMANPHYVDVHLDSSARSYGSLISERPDLMNYRRLGFVNTITPEAWLSTWSANTSNADIVRNLPDVQCPVLCIHAAGDKEIFPATDVAPIQAALTASDHTALVLPGRHYFEADVGQRTRPDTEALMDVVVPWIQERFGDD